MLIGLLVIGALAFLILSHEAGHFFAAKRFGLKVDEFGVGFPPRIVSWWRGETEYSLNWLPLGGFVRIAGENDRLLGDLEKLELLPAEEKKRLFFTQPPWRRAAVILAGVAVNVVIGWALLSAVFMIGTPRALLISGVQPGSPAEAVGLREGDMVKHFETAEAFIAFVDANRGVPIEVRVVRGEIDHAFTVTPRVDPGPDEGAVGVLLAESGIERYGPLRAIGEGLRSTGYVFWATVRTFGQLVSELFTQGRLLPDVVGPVGIFSLAARTGEVGLIHLLQLVAIISINLAALNLIPFPALDGGRFFLILVEKLKGSPISRKAELAINGLGFAFLVVVMLLVTIRDVSRWF